MPSGVSNYFAVLQHRHAFRHVDPPERLDFHRPHTVHGIISRSRVPRAPSSQQARQHLAPVAIQGVLLLGVCGLKALHVCADSSEPVVHPPAARQTP
jgi:hypothetical protein